MDLLAANACLILQLAQRSDIPVYIGAKKPLTSEYHGHSGIRVHGDNGIGNVKDFPLEKVDLSPIQKEEAKDFIISHCKKYSGEITIATLGPMTNLALAVKDCPELSKYVKEVVSMAGGITVPPKHKDDSINVIGNKSPVAEANVHNDPDAAKIVFHAGFNIRLFTINMTTQILMKEQFLNDLKSLGVIGKFIYDVNVHYGKFYESIGEETPIHDSTPIMYLLKPEIFGKDINIYVDVETKGELTSGMLVPDWRNHFPQKKPNIIFPFYVDTETFLKEYYLRIKNLVNSVEKEQKE